LLFGTVDDVGWTHATNLGRLTLNRHLRAKFGDDTFETVAYPGAFFMSEADREVLINSTIRDECNFILAGSDNILNNKHVEYALEFPNVSFTRFSGANNLNVDKLPMNLVEYEGNWLDPSFVAGAVAASTSHKCAGFINALESARSAWGHATGFALGYHWVKSHQDVHIITMDSYYNPDAEQLAAQLLIESKGCDVIGRHTDPNQVDQFVASLQGKVLSIARYVDMSTFVSDTVFTSQVIDFFDYVGPAVEPAFLSAKYRQTGAMYKLPPLNTITTTSTSNMQDYRQYQNPTAFGDNATTRLGNLGFDMQLSPFTSMVDQQYAKEVETVALEYLQLENPLCGAHFRNGTSATPMGDECPTIFTIEPVHYLLLPNTTYYDAFQDGGALCGAGQYYYYHDNLTLECLPCPENTVYSNGTGGRASTTCTPCENGTVAPMGSSQCAQPATIVEMQQAVGASIGGSLAALFTLILCILAALVYAQKRGIRDNRNAPKTPDTQPIAVLFTDIQASTTIWANAPEAMSQAVEDHHDLIRQILKQHRGYEVKTIGDAFMVVHSDITKAVAIALDIQRKLHQHDWKTKDIDEVYRNMEAQSDSDGHDEDDLRLSLRNSSNSQPQSPPEHGQKNVHAESSTTTVQHQNTNNHHATTTNDHNHHHDKSWNGLRIRVGMAYGTCDGQKDPVTHGWDYYGTLVNTAARVEAAAHGGQVVLTGAAYEALLQSSSAGAGKEVHDNNNVSNNKRPSAKCPVVWSVPPKIQEELGVASAKSHGDISLRGLSEPLELIELVPIGFEKRQFPPLRIETDNADVEEPDGDHFGDDGSVAGGSVASGVGSALNHMDFAHMDAEEKMTRLTDIALKVAGIKKYDERLAMSVRFAFDSLRALLSLHAAQDRETLLKGLLSKWHLQPPKLTPQTLEDIGGKEVLHLLMLSVRSATVALATRQKESPLKMMNDDSFLTGSFVHSRSMTSPGHNHSITSSKNRSSTRSHEHVIANLEPLKEEHANH